jgi:hypothetical protein
MGLEMLVQQLGGKPLGNQGLVIFLCSSMGELFKEIAQIVVRLEAASFSRLDQGV